MEITIKLSLDNLTVANEGIVVKVYDKTQTAITPEPDSMGLLEFMDDLIRRLHEDGSLRRAETYTCARNSFRRFTGGTDIAINKIDGLLIDRYETFLKKGDKSLNTISFYMRILRAVYNRAVDMSVTSDKQPFRKVYTSIGKTEKRAMGIDGIRKIKDFKPDSSAMEFARDMFMFSFYTMGMSFVDMAYLKISDIRNGLLVYKRKKTGQHLSIRWNERMQQISDRHPTKTGVYLLPIITKINGKERNQYRYMQYIVNSELKQMASMLKLNNKLTMYVTRHSWASIAKQMGIPIEVISKGLGHDSEKTTKIYLKDFDTFTIDNANEKIIKALDVI